MAVDIERRRLIVTELGNNTVGVVDLGQGKVLQALGGLKEPQGVGYLPSTDTPNADLLQAQQIWRHREPSSNTLFARARFRISSIPASPPSSVFCCRIAVETVVSAQTLLVSCRNGGTGELFI
jgi:hypothetical protein